MIDNLCIRNFGVSKVTAYSWHIVVVVQVFNARYTVVRLRASIV